MLARRAPNATTAARQASGLHLIGDLHGCHHGGALMHDAAALEAFCRQQVLSAGLTPVGHLFHGFEEGGGVTGVVVLAESHLSVHTWPETGYVTLDVYVCNYSADNRAKAQALFDGIVAAFGPHKQTVHCIERG
ncbi:MAG TPA: adenosylmethionine decarboxylase [Comamonadaceae bacterium]|nr:MAG: S-adenosylmethionine decarboxylase proenzyme [Burkholderiales bacterium RIFCSPLOWO2_12_FULL_65_40]HCE29815.1 adenosylmethionine decarboxylase [Comamonadaceae bacterium]